jgi:hypothetical protein
MLPTPISIISDEVSRFAGLLMPERHSAAISDTSARRRQRCAVLPRERRCATRASGAILQARSLPPAPLYASIDY